jgi:hypothetical protein
VKGEMGKTQYFDPSDKMKITTNETTLTSNTGAGIKGLSQNGYVYGNSYIPASTMKELTIDNRSANMISGPQMVGQAFNPNDVLKNTIRQTTENNTFSGVIDKNNEGQGNARIVNDRTRTTIKETTIDHNHVGAAHMEITGPSFDPTDVLKTTTRQTTERNEYINPAQMNMDGGYHVQQAGTNMKVTSRQTTEKNSYINPAQMNMEGGYHIQQAGTNMPVTIREMTAETAHVDQPYEPHMGGYEAEEAGTNMPTTMRETTTAITRTDQPAMAIDLGHMANPQNIPNTARQGTCDVMRMGTGMFLNEKNRTYDAHTQNAQFSDRRTTMETRLDKHMPTLSNYDKSPDVNNYNMRLKIPTLYSHYTNAERTNASPYKTLIGAQTKTGRSTRLEDTRLDSCILDMLKKNPLIIKCI